MRPAAHNVLRSSLSTFPSYMLCSSLFPSPDCELRGFHTLPASVGNLFDYLESDEVAACLKKHLQRATTDLQVVEDFIASFLIDDFAMRSSNRRLRYFRTRMGNKRATAKTMEQRAKSKKRAKARKKEESSPVMARNMCVAALSHQCGRSERTSKMPELPLLLTFLQHPRAKHLQRVVVDGTTSVRTAKRGRHWRVCARRKGRTRRWPSNRTRSSSPILRLA